jgi:hypothetical protein
MRRTPTVPVRSSDSRVNNVPFTANFDAADSGLLQP